MNLNRHRLLQRLSFLVGGGFLLASLLWLGLGENKSAAILLGLAAVVSARILYVTLPEYLEEPPQAQEPGSDGSMMETSENPAQDGPPSDRSDPT